MTGFSLKSSILTRMVAVFLLTIVLLIPLVMVRALIAERQNRQQSAILEVTDKWAQAQTLTGPVLTVPLKHTVPSREGRDTTFIDNLHILPDTLEISGDLSTQVRYRGIYEVVVYGTRIHVSGRFDLSGLPPQAFDGAVPLWSEAYITVGISDLRGIKDSVRMTWGATEMQPEAGVRSADLVSSGITLRAPVNQKMDAHTFDLSMSLNGSSDLSFTPVGRRTHVSMRAAWSSPSFTGAFLPDERAVDPDGFTADWTILELNRKFPQWWVGSRFQVDQSNFGVSLLLPVDHYQKAMRSVKYAVMVIMLTFLALFLSEVLVREILHPVHYTLVGLALVLFYALLLSLSEHFGFDRSYLISALGVLVPVTLYARAIVARKRVATLLGTLLLIVYAFFYVLLRLEDWALLIGSLALLLVLTAVMYLTRKVNWFSMGEG